MRLFNALKKLLGINYEEKVNIIEEPETITEIVEVPEVKKNNITTIEEHLINIKNMTKLELDEYAQVYGVSLDRRRKKNIMMEEFIQKLKEKN
jgi:hypothetical protein